LQVKSKTVTIEAKLDTGGVVREIARERIGPVKPSRAIAPKNQRKKPKHKKPPTAEDPPS
jgi:hypothetical protein